MDRILFPESNEELVKDIPEDLPILPLRNTVVYPFSIMPLVIGISRSVRLMESVLAGNHMVGLIAMKDPSIREPLADQIYEIGTVAKVTQSIRTPGHSLQVVIQGIERFRIAQWLQSDPFMTARIHLSPDEMDTGIEFEAMSRSLRELAKEVIALSPNLTEQAGDFINQVKDPRYLVYMITSNLSLSVEDGQKILEMDRIKKKVISLISYLTHEKEVLTLGRQIESRTKKEMNKAQREYYLRQQLKTIQKELGETDQDLSLVAEYEEKIGKAGLPEEAEKEVLRELKRLEGMHPQSAEYTVIKTYLDWLIDLPWNVLSEDQLDIHHARGILDEDHYDLQDVKDRVIEYLAVRKLVNERESDPIQTKEGSGGKAIGAILCFAGPPGVGKTSLGQSIARALGRKFTRMSLGGMRDEAEIRGHRRTYIGAMPGRIIQAIKRSGSRNPVFMLDEVDKIGIGWRGDPSSALLEVLDPAQNHAFRDHYLDVDFDLSQVIFITTANTLETIPEPLRDRMEIIRIEGYTEHEKAQIARDFLIARQVSANGLRDDEISFTEEALYKIIREYTQEAGVRNLERQIGTICRKVSAQIASQDATHVEILPETVREFLKKERYTAESSEAIEVPGIATGLAVTRYGGDILFIEATRMKGSGGTLTLTGQLGDVMRESAQIAYSYVRSKFSGNEVAPELFEQSQIHIHVPAGAIPKDGPSAGIAMVMAIASLFTCRPVRSTIGMTGEVTLRGRVLPVGGIKMKVLAAHRAGLKQVILPKRNEADLEDLPDEVRRDIRFIPVERIDDALAAALVPLTEEENTLDFPAEEDMESYQTCL